MQRSPCQPRSVIVASAILMPSEILPASKPGGRDGSEKSTVSGVCPTKNTRGISISLERGWPSSVGRFEMVREERANGVQRLLRGLELAHAGLEDVGHAFPDR